MYPSLKTTCHIKLKFLLWTKILEILLLAKYIVSVTATLINTLLNEDFDGLFKINGQFGENGGNACLSCKDKQK